MLKMEAICCSKRSFDLQRTTWRYNPQDRILHSHRCGTSNLQHILNQILPERLWGVRSMKHFLQNRLRHCRDSNWFFVNTNSHRYGYTKPFWGIIIANERKTKFSVRWSEQLRDTTKRLAVLRQDGRWQFAYPRRLSCGVTYNCRQAFHTVI